jgi:acetyl-CoA synthetase
MNLWLAAALELDGLPAGRGLNIAHEALDRHVARGAADLQAFRFIGPRNEVEVLSYGELETLSNRFANVLDTLGVHLGDSVFALTERVPELYIAALGALKARCPFSVLFSSFGPDPIRVRLAIGGARVLVASDTLYQRKVAHLRTGIPGLRHVLSVGALAPGCRSFAALLSEAGDDYRIGPTDPEDPALLHFTSGTTGAPKGAVHVHQAVVAHYATARLALGLAPGDVYWCTADPGWVTGVSYGLIAPLVCGVTSIVDRGPFDVERWYRIIERERVSVLYTAPTAIRMLMRAGAGLARRFDLGSLRIVATAGEPLDAEAVRWSREALGVPIHDTWWQTETGAIMIGNLPGRDVVAGSMGRPLPGVEAAVVRRTAAGGVEPIAAAEAEGELALAAGWPSMFRDYLGEPERYRRCFADGFYLTGDLVRRDPAGGFRFVGRIDEVIKSAGHLIGPFEVESALLEHPAVAEAGVIGRPDPVTGESIKAFVALKPGTQASERLRRQLLGHARRRLGSALAPREIAFSRDLPRTRSGKIMRRLLKARELGLPEGDLSMLDEHDGGG